MRSLLAANDLERGKAQADRLLDRESIQLDKSSPEYHRFVRDVLVGIADALGIVADQDQGIFYDPDGPRPVKVAIGDHSDGIRTSEQVRQDNANLRALFSVHAKELVATKRASKEWSSGYIDDAEKAFELFKEFVGDKPIAHYTRAEAIFLVNQLSRMPIGVGQQHP